MQTLLIRKLASCLLLLLLYACGPAQDDQILLQQRVSDAIASAEDLPAENLAVEVESGAVRISGSLHCEDCGGMRTPGGEQTIQQTLGAVVRAVPGVERVEFDLQ